MGLVLCGLPCQADVIASVRGSGIAMKQNAGIKPYKGSENYIFVSYAHRDADRVFEVIRRMIDAGLRVWFDEGIDPGTEWDANIASHIVGCSSFVAFISQNYLYSDNCKDELNFARDLKKDRLLVYLEDVKLPLGMAMRLNRLQAIHQYTYAVQEEFYEKLLTVPQFYGCRCSSAGSSDSGRTFERSFQDEERII